MKRVLGFLIGAGLSAGVIYGLRRLMSGPAPVAPTPPATHPASPPPAPAPAPSKAESNGKPNIRIHRSGSRPQTSSAESSNGSGSPVTPVEGGSTEPLASGEIISPPMETGEPAIPQNAVIEPPAPAETPTAEPEATDSSWGSHFNRQSHLDQAADTNKPADFTPIKDIGPVFNKRLREAGIITYSALATLTAEEISEKTGIPAERIERGRWREQAAELNQGRKAEG